LDFRHPLSAERVFSQLSQDFSLNAEYQYTIFGFIGYANGITQTMLFPYCLTGYHAMLLVAGLVVARASFSNTKTSRRLLVLAAY
jgi:hypothetical protein